MYTDIAKYRQRFNYIIGLITNSSQRKHTLRWIRALKNDFLFDLPCPWFVFDAIDYIEPYLFKGMNIFEYSSGGSTLYWLKRGANVVTIEHDPKWSEFMKERLQPYNSIDYRLICPEHIENDLDDPSDPDKYKSNWMKNTTFVDYVSQIDGFPDGYFDIVIIDGRARPSCIKHSVSKVKIGGHIILDNSERKYYFIKTEKYFKNFERYEFYGAGPVNAFEWKTDIYKRIK